jgi:chromosome segregation ATPase
MEKLEDWEREIVEQGEQAETMEESVEEHKARAEQLDKSLGELRAAMAELNNDALREAAASLEKARAENQQQLDQLREQRDQMLQENATMMQKVLEQNEKRRRVRQRVSMMMAMFTDASADFKGQIESANEALQEDLKHLADAEANLLEVRHKLEMLDFTPVT